MTQGTCDHPSVTENRAMGVATCTECGAVLYNLDLLDE